MKLVECCPFGFDSSLNLFVSVSISYVVSLSDVDIAFNEGFLKLDLV